MKQDGVRFVCPSTACSRSMLSFTRLGFLFTWMSDSLFSALLSGSLRTAEFATCRSLDRSMLSISTFGYCEQSHREATDWGAGDRRDRWALSTSYPLSSLTIESKKQAVKGLMNGNAAYHLCLSVSSSVK